MFCDIMDFDKIIEQEGKNIVIILDNLFRVFDNLCHHHGVQKIEVKFNKCTFKILYFFGIIFYEYIINRL